MIIRWIQMEEIEEWISLLSESFPVQTTKEKIQKNLNEDHRILIAKKQDQLVGSILINKEKNFIENFVSFRLHNICVKKEFRNQKIATSMLREVDRIAREENIDFIDLTSSNNREVAQHVYLKNGYEKRESCLFRKNIS